MALEACPKWAQLSNKSTLPRTVQRCQGPPVIRKPFNVSNALNCHRPATHLAEMLDIAPDVEGGVAMGDSHSRLHNECASSTISDSIRVGCIRRDIAIRGCDSSCNRSKDPRSIVGEHGNSKFTERPLVPGLIDRKQTGLKLPKGLIRVQQK